MIPERFSDPVHGSVSRPAMWLGVPITPLVVAGGVICLLATYINIFMLALLVPVVFVMAEVTRNDDQRWRLLGLYLRYRVKQRNAKYWRAASYAPIRYQRRT